MLQQQADRRWADQPLQASQLPQGHAEQALQQGQFACQLCLLAALAERKLLQQVQDQVLPVATQVGQQQRSQQLWKPPGLITELVQQVVVQQTRMCQLLLLAGL